MLNGTLVIEFAEGVAGPLAAVRLSDLGADVIKLEVPTGDWLRGAAPVIPNTEIGAAFFELNRGKRSMMMDAGAGVATRLQAFT